MARELRDGARRLRRDAPRRGTAAVQLRRHRAHGARRAGARMGRTDWVEGLAAERGTPIGPESGGGLAPGGSALVDYYRARIAQLRRVRQAASSGRRAGVARQDRRRRDAEVSPAGVPGRIDESAAVVRQGHNRLLLHNSSDVAPGGGEESGCQSGLRPRSHPLDGGTRSDAGPLSPVVNCPPPPELRPQNPRQW